jgi:hypothetical protein
MIAVSTILSVVLVAIAITLMILVRRIKTNRV